MAMLPIVTSHGERVFGERAAISGAGLETDQLHPAAGALSNRPGLGAIVCLCVLGWAKPNGVEAVLRAVVGVLTLLAAGILLYDVTFGPGRRLETRGKL